MKLLRVTALKIGQKKRLFRGTPKTQHIVPPFVVLFTRYVTQKCGFFPTNSALEMKISGPR